MWGERPVWGDQRRRPHRRNESGSALLLLPAGVLVVLLLGAVVVDTAVVYLAAREAESAAAAAANDLATLAVDGERLRSEGTYVIDGHVAAALVPVIDATTRDRLSAAFEPGSVQVEVRALSETEVEVVVSGTAQRVVGVLGWAGLAPSRTVQARAVGVASD